MQRLAWQSKLGNLALIPKGLSGSQATASADFEIKAEFFRQSGAEAQFPTFSGGISAPNGRYSKHKFSFDECRLRHADLLEILSDIFGL
jgi:hypothetical protein